MLSPDQRERGRTRVLWFTAFNALSFTLITGNLISLYLLRLGASNSLIGVVASFAYVSFFFLVLGRAFVPRVGVIRLFGWAWLLRYIAFLPVIVAPAVLTAGSPRPAFLLVTIGVFGFHVFRGLGIVGNAPLFAGFATDADRGRLLSQVQMIVSVVSVVVGTTVALLLGREAPLIRFVAFLSTGVGFGFVATGVLFTLPELEEQRSSARRPLAPQLRALWETPAVRRFFVTFLIIAITSGVGRSFFVVYAKQVHGYGDRLAFLMVAVGSVGNFLAGYLGSLLLDRLGARPLILFSLAAYGVSLVVAIVVPPGAGTAAAVAVAAMFLLGTMGFAGNENSSQAYFFGITQREDQLNLGIVFFLTLGIGGTIGSFAGGFVLDGLSTFLPVAWAYRLLFGVTAVVIAVAFLRASRLASLGAETFRGTLEVIFSLRDLRAVGLLSRLDRSREPHRERDTIRSIAQSGSPLAIRDVLERLRSPSYAIRQEALEALGRLPYTAEVESALIEHLDAAPHTTAAAAVRLLGRRGTERAIPAVAAAIDAEDPLLGDRAIVAYARLAGRSAEPRLTELLGTTTHPRRVLHVAVALQVAGTTAAMPGIIERFRDETVPQHILDELLFAASRIQGIYDWFYPRYSRYVRTTANRRDLAADLRSAAPVWMHPALTALIEDDDAGRAIDVAVRAYRDTGEEVPAPEGLPVTLLRELPARGRIVFFLFAVMIAPKAGADGA